MKKIRMALGAIGVITLMCSNVNAYNNVKNIQRISGKNRYETSIEISKKFYKKSDIVVIADGKNFPDAICSTGLSGYYKAPIILANDKSDEYINEIKRLKSTKAIIIGGKKSINSNIENKLKKYITVERISGKDRYETSFMVAKKLKKLGVKFNSIYISNGNKYTDCLSIATLAGLDNSPILLSKKNEIPSYMKKILSTNVKKYIVGGKKSISYTGLDGEKFERISGKDRYETASKIAKIAFKNPKEVILSSGIDFADTLLSTTVSRIKNAPILLNDNNKLLDINKNYIQENNIYDIMIVGGDKTISNKIEKEYKNSMKENIISGISASSDPTHVSINTGHIYSKISESLKSDSNYEDYKKENEDSKKSNFIKIDDMDVFKGDNDISDNYYILGVKERKKISDAVLLKKLEDKLKVEKEKIYIIDGKDDTSKLVIVIDKNLRDKKFEKGKLEIEDGIYYSTDNNKMVKDSSLYNSKIKFISGDVSSENIINVDQAIIGNTNGNTLNSGIGVNPCTKIVEGINFKVQNTKREALEYNTIISSVGSTKDKGDGIKIYNNLFDFGEESDYAVNGISIYGNKAGSIEIVGNKSKGKNKGRMIGRASSGAGIIRIISEPEKGTEIIVRNNIIEESEYHGILLMTADDVKTDVESNLLSNIGQNGITLSCFGNCPITLKNNEINDYGKRKIITGGNFLKPEKSEVNDFEKGLVIDYISPVYGVNINDTWFNDREILIKNLNQNNKIKSSIENNKVDGVMDSKEIEILRNHTFLDPKKEINQKYKLSKYKMTIIKDKDGDEIFGQNPKKLDKKVTVGSLQIIGKGSGLITLPQNLNILGDLIIDCPNADLKNIAKVDGNIIIKNIKNQDKSSFDLTDNIEVTKKYAEIKENSILVENITNKDGLSVDKSKSNIKNIEVIENKDGKKNILDKSMYSINDDEDKIIISPGYLNQLDKDTVLTIKYRDEENKITEIEKNVNIILKDKTSGLISVRENSILEYTYKHAESPIVLEVKNVHDMSGKLIDKSETKLSGHVSVEGILLNSEPGDFTVDDENDTITIMPSFLNKIKSTNYPNSNSVGLGLSGEIKVTYADPENKIGEIKTKVKVKVNNYSSLDIRLISPLTFIEGNAPDEGISFEFYNARDCTGKIISPDKIDYTNIGIEAFPFDWKYEVSDKDKISFSKDLYTIDAKNGILTFKKSYLDKLNIAKEVNTEHGTKVYTFTLYDEKNGLDFRSEKFTIHIKRKQINLDNNTNISSRNGVYTIHNYRISSGKELITENTNVRDLVENLVGENPRVLIRVYPENEIENGIPKNKNNFRSLNSKIKINDKVIVIAEDGETMKSYSLDVKNDRVTPTINIETDPKYRALMIANYDYPGKKFDLVGPKNDLGLMKNFFDSSNFDGVKFSEVYSMENLTKEKLLNAIKEKFKNNNENDITYFYYSGHGNNIDQKSYICTVDQFEEKNNVEESKKEAEKAWISVSELREALDNVKGTKVVIFDSCNSGGFIGKDAVDVVSEPTKVSGERKISVTSIGKDGNIESQKFNENVTREFSNNSVSNSESNKYLVGEEYKVLTASSGNEYSYEDIKSGYGKFTKELNEGIKVINNKIKADRNNDNKISIEEMYHYLMTHVQYTSHIQAYPRKDSFTIYQITPDKDENNSSTTDVSEGSLDNFNIRTTKKGKINNLNIRLDKENDIIIGGIITSSVVKINTNLTVGELISCIEKDDEHQEVYVQSYDTKPNKSLIKNSDKKLKKNDLLLIVSPNGKMITIKIEVKDANDPSVPNFNGKYTVNKKFRTIASGTKKLTAITLKKDFLNDLIVPEGFEVKYISSENDSEFVSDGDKIAIIHSTIGSFPKPYRLIVEAHESELDELD